MRWRSEEIDRYQRTGEGETAVGGHNEEQIYSNRNLVCRQDEGSVSGGWMYGGLMTLPNRTVYCHRFYDSNHDKAAGGTIMMGT